MVFFPENMILLFRRKMKDDLSQKNTWKDEIFHIIWSPLSKKQGQSSPEKIHLKISSIIEKDDVLPK